jgi:NAD(P)-dependent dehydrogenase (short-subunit alcohol dehydrogenase family)
MTKIALVTGGSRGLGKDMAIALAKKGIDVVVTYRSKKEEAEAVVNEIKSIGRKSVLLPLNMSDFQALDSFMTQLASALSNTWGVDKFDFLVNNAGMGATVPIAQVTEEIFDEFMNVHFKGVYFITQKSLNIMNDGGGIVNISSGTTRFIIPGYSVYSSMKAAVELFTRSVAKEFGARGIRSNIVAPGPVETDFNNAAIRNNPQMKSGLGNLTALGRVGNADDIGSVVAFLCTDDAKWITGQRIEVSGGINL